jgi:nitroreductase
MKSILLKLLPRSIKELAKKCLSTFSILTVKLFSINGFTASIYYLILDRSFYREHKASLLGRLSFQKKLKQVDNSSALLRRNIHRLEKGLIMRPRRASFAEAYVLETVEVFILAVQTKGFCKKELKWATDVLQKYFEVVEDQGRISLARATFATTNEPVSGNHSKAKSVPYSHASLPAPSVEFEELTQLYTRRRSVRWYQDRQVEKKSLEKAVNSASLAPSACNRQPFFFNYTTDGALASNIAELAMGTVGFAGNIPALIVVVGDLSNYPSERDRHVIYIDASLAAMQLMLALETLGLSSCPINWPDVESRERLMQNKLGLQYFERPIMLIAVGYAMPAGEIPFSQKKSADMLLKEIL